MKFFDPMKHSRRYFEKSFYSGLRAKRARETFRAPRRRKDSILENAEYLGALSEPWPVYVCEVLRLKKEDRQNMVIFPVNFEPFLGDLGEPRGE